ncbi:MAG TPA: hypothetical protein P5133_09010, partial [Spirochaetia bacterium]|nr:hypothetical protein [Spirochaetia bacterium]
ATTVLLRVAQSHRPQPRAELEWIWTRRSFLSLVELTEDQRDIWLRLRRTPLKEGKQYLPKYAAA